MTAIRHIERDELKHLLNEMDIESVLDSEGNVYAVFPADDEFPYDLVFHFFNDDNGWFGMSAIADGYDLKDNETIKALQIVNEFSRRARIPKVFVQNGRFKAEQWVKFPGGTNDDYVKDYIGLVLSMCWTFFAETKKLMIE